MAPNPSNSCSATSAVITASPDLQKTGTVTEAPHFPIKTVETNARAHHPEATKSTKSCCCTSTMTSSEIADSTTSAAAEVDHEDPSSCNMSSRADEDAGCLNRVFDKAREIVVKRFEGSEFGCRLDAMALFGVPRLSRNELALGKRLGKGSFSTVDEIRGIMLNRSSIHTVATVRSNSQASCWCTITSNKIQSTRSSLPCLDRPVFLEVSDKPTPSLSSKTRTSGFSAALKKIPRPGRGAERQDTIASGNHESRAFMEQHCVRKSGEARYAIKMVRRDVFQNKDNEKNMVAGVCDLAVETFFLSSLEHVSYCK